MPLVYPFTPDWLDVVALGGQLLDISTIREHGVKLGCRPALGRKHQVYAVRSPPRILITSGTMRKLDRHAFGDIHHENVVVSRFVTLGPRKREDLSVGIPGW